LTSAARLTVGKVISTNKLKSWMVKIKRKKVIKILGKALDINV
jgi:ribosomal protein S17